MQKEKILFSFYKKYDILVLMKRFFLLFISFSLFACGGYQTVPITLPDGFIIHARIADTPQKQAQGLMFVKNLPENEGMLFVFDEETEQLFWMKNTLIDLDMVFIGANKQVNSVEAEVPHSYTYTPDDQIAYVPGYGQYVLEIASKTAAKHGVEMGSYLQFETGKTR